MNIKHIVKIKSIEIIPDEDRYDLEVEDNHNFYANSILVHNCRCIVKADGMWSRTGKKWISAPHIFEKLKPLFDTYPDLIFDGELYFHSHEDNFNEVISLIKKSKPSPEDLTESANLVQYWIYDLPSCSGPFSEREAELVRLFKECPLIFDKSFVNVDTYTVTSKPEIQSYLERFVSEDFEGAIVRLDKPYECRRSKNLLKVKQFQDEEYLIIRFEEGRGNLAGCVGNVVVDVDGKEVSAGLKFSHEEAQEFWLHRNLYTGKKATIKYFNKTVDGSLRFPKCIQIDRQSYE